MVKQRRACVFCNRLLFALVVLCACCFPTDSQPVNPDCVILTKNQDGEWIADTSTIEEFSGDIQALVECMAPGDTLLFNTELIELPTTLILNQPIQIGSGIVNETGNGNLNIPVKCPKNESAIEIGSGVVRLSDLSFDGCNLNGSSIITILPGSEVTITTTDFSNNVNGAGPACIDATQSRLEIHQGSFSGNVGQEGGAVRIDGNSELLMSGTDFKNNSAVVGGAMAVVDSAVDIQSGLFENNEAVQRGGGVQFEALSDPFKMKITASLFKGNRITGEAGPDPVVTSGGGVSTEGNGASLDIIGSDFINNTAVGYGGALLFSNSSELVVARSSFLNNTAFQGGAIQVETLYRLESNTTARFINSDFSGNRVEGDFEGFAPFGGAVLVADTVQFEMSDCELANNTAEHTGGGLELIDVQTGAVRDTSFVNNYAEFGGGALEAFETFKPSILVVEGVVFDSNAVDTTVGQGGAVAIAMNYSYVEFNNTLFKNNSAESAGAMLGRRGADVFIKNSTFVENKASESGGAMLWSGTAEPANLIVVGSNFDGNVATNGAGGAVVLSNENTTCLIGGGTNFTNNTAAKGGAVWFEAMFGFANLTIRDTFFGDNVATKSDGGALGTNELVDSELENVDFVRNRAVYGGAVYVTDSGRKNMSLCTFVGNHATKMGGACYFEHKGLNDYEYENVENLKVSINQSVFLNNTAGTLLEQDNKSVLASLTGKGGALAVVGSGTDVILIDSVIRHSKATMGGGIYWENGVYLTGEEVVLESNQAAVGGGMFVQSSDISFRIFNLTSWVFFGNMAQNGGALFLAGVRDTFETLANLDYGDLGRYVYMYDAIFSNNVVSERGGGVIVEHMALFCQKCTFTENKAGMEKSPIVPGGLGGAILVGQDALVQINASEVFGNDAVQGGGVFVGNGQFVGASVNFTNNSAVEVGGAVAMDYDGLLTTRSAVVMICQGCNMTENKAQIGGGIYLAMEQPDSERLSQCASLNDTEVISEMPQTRIFDLAEACLSIADLPRLLSDRHILLTETVLLDNQAEVSGDAVYTSDLRLVYWCCENLCQSLETGLPIERCEGGVEFGERKDGGGSGSLVSSAVSRIDIMPRRIEGVSSGAVLVPVTLTLKDSLGQVVYGQDMDLVVRSEPPVILSGTPVTGVTLQEGVSIVTDITLTAPPGQHVVTFEIKSKILGYELTADLPVTVRECGKEEVFDTQTMSCFGYGQDSFQFHAPAMCALSPGDETCTGKTTVPLDGYWQSSPHSGRGIAKCLNEQACGYDNRAAELSTASFLALNEGKTLNWRNDSYKQCAKGYKGPLCGSCADDYGRVGTLDCAKCPGIAMSDFFITLAFAAIFLVSACLTRCTLNKTRQLEVAMAIREASETAQPSGPESQTTAVFPDASQIEGVQGELNASSSQGVWEIELASADTLPTIKGVVRSDAPDAEDGGENGGRNVACVSVQGSFRSREVFKILLNFAQVVGAAAAIHAHWTESVLKVLGIADLFSWVSNGAGLVSFECAHNKPSDARSLRAHFNQIYLPLSVWLVFAVYWAICKCVRKWNMKQLSKRLGIGLMVILYVGYMNIARRAIGVYNCANVDVSTDQEHSDALWVNDTSVRCYKGSHAVLAVVESLLLVTVVIGYPLTVAWKLWRNRRSLDDENFESKYGFFYKAYSKDAVFWELLVFIRKGLLAVLIVFSDSLGASQQAILAVFILGFALWLHKNYRPYTDSLPKLNDLESYSLAISVLVFLSAGLFLQNQEKQGVLVALSVVVILLVLGFALYALYELGLGCHQMLEEWLVQKHLPKNGKIFEDIRTAVAYCLRNTKRKLRRK